MKEIYVDSNYGYQEAIQYNATRLYSEIKDRDFILFDAPKDRVFLTCDRPVINGRDVTFFPLNEKVMLVLRPNLGTKFQRKSLTNIKWFREFNKMIVQNDYRVVVCSNQTFLDTMIKRYG